MNQRVIGRLLALLAAAFMLTQISPALAQEAASLLGCSDNAVGIELEAGESMLMSCPADCGSRGVWGTDVYTDDSTICTAARHAGVIDSSGGEFRLLMLEGQDSYDGSDRNGVVTANWTSPWPRSIAFESAVQTDAMALDCGAAAVLLDLTVGESAVVTCPADCTSGVSWGTLVYTDDSSVCWAAQHAGVIGAEGGSFRLTALGPQDAFPGSTRNGITSESWNSTYDGSFEVRALDPAEAATAEAVASFDIPPLNQSISKSSEDGTFSGLAPEGWYVDTRDLPLIATTEAAADASQQGPDGEYPPDSLVIQVVLPASLREGLGEDVSADVQTAAEQVATMMQPEMSAETLTLDGLDLPHAYLPVEPGIFTPPDVEAAIVAVDYDGTVLVYLVGYNVDAEAAETVLARVAGAAEFVTPTTTGPVDSSLLQDGRFVFENPADSFEFSVDVPEGWTAVVSETGAPGLANNPEAVVAVATNPDDSLPPDSIGIQVQLPDVIQDTFGIDPALGGQAVIEAFADALQPVFGPPQKLPALATPHVFMLLNNTGELPAGVNGAALIAITDDEAIAYFIIFNGEQSEMEAALVALIESASYLPQ